jgi:transposase
MDADRQVILDQVAALEQALATERAKGLEVAAELAVARAKAAEDSALIAHQKLQIAKLQRQIYGPRSERSSRLIDQLALTFEELEAAATEDELAAERAVAKTTTVRGFTRKRAERQTFPEHLPRERVAIDPPASCECCGGSRLRKIGEDVTRTLECVPRQWKVVETVREKFSCRDCEKISQPPAPFHAVARGWAGPNLLAMIMFEKFGQHQPLNRQSERYALEGVFIMADIEENARRKAAGKREIPLSPIAIEVVRRIDALFEVERSIDGKSAQERLDVRRTLSGPLVEDLQGYMREQLARLSRGHDLAKAFNYVLKRWASFTLFLEDGRVCLSNNAAERGLRGIALGRKSWLFCGSDRGGQRAAALYSLIVTAKMNGVDPQVWLADVIARIATHPAHRLDELLPWNWTSPNPAISARAA